MIKFDGNDYNSRINTNFKAGEKKDKKMDDIKELKKKVIDEAERRMTDVGPFSVEVEQKNMNPFKYLSSYGVKIKPESTDDKAPRVVRFFAKNESETYEHESGSKAKGTRDEILEYLKFGDFLEDLQNYIDTVSDKFYMDGNR